ncbi:MAG: OmpH family outer membrane protein [Chlamydiota bacterium]
MKKYILQTFLAVAFCGTCFAESSGIVNFASCIMESKYGKQEQEQLEKIKKQWSSLIEETEKELKSLSAKLEDQNYLDGLSPAATEELKVKQRTLGDDLGKYQSQLYQILNQANYGLIQKMFGRIAESSEKVAAQKKLDMVINKEACFFYKPTMDITKDVVTDMDKNFDKEKASKPAAANDAVAPATKEVAKAAPEKKVAPSAKK